MQLSEQQRAKLRAEIRQLLETDKLTAGLQQRFAETYNVSRQRVHQIVKDERERFRNPVSWEIDRARKERRKINPVKIYEELLKANHPAFAHIKDPAN